VQEHVKHVCCWCDRIIVDDSSPDAATTHGICGRCAATFERQLHDNDKTLTPKAAIK